MLYITSKLISFTYWRLPKNCLADRFVCWLCLLFICVAIHLSRWCSSLTHCHHTYFMCLTGTWGWDLMGLQFFEPTVYVCRSEFPLATVSSDDSSTLSCRWFQTCKNDSRRDVLKETCCFVVMELEMQRMKEQVSKASGENVSSTWGNKV